MSIPTAHGSHFHLIQNYIKNRVMYHPTNIYHVDCHSSSFEVGSNYSTGRSLLLLLLLSSFSCVLSGSVRPNRRQPTRLPHPWDSPGKNTGVGCHFLLQCMKAKSESEVAQLCPTLSDPMDCSLPGSSVHGIFQARVLEWGAIHYLGPNMLVLSHGSVDIYR